MAKKPKVATLPGASPSATLQSFLTSASESAKPPSGAGKSTGSLPTNRPK